MIMRATDQFVMSSSMSWEGVGKFFFKCFDSFGGSCFREGCGCTYIDVDPFLLREGLVFVHEDSFRHGERNAVLKDFASKIM